MDKQIIINYTIIYIKRDQTLINKYNCVSLNCWFTQKPFEKHTIGKLHSKRKQYILYIHLTKQSKQLTMQNQ